MQTYFRRTVMKTELADVIVIAIISFCVVFLDLAHVPIKSLSLSIRRELIILIWGYGGDVLERFSAVYSAAVSGVRALVDVDYARWMLNQR